MRQPRHVTLLRLPVENPREALRRDEALLDAAFDRHNLGGNVCGNVGGNGPGHQGESVAVRWWVASVPAVVVGLGLRHRLDEVVDIDRCAAAGVEVIQRSAGGGALIVDEGMLCGAIRVAPPPSHDVTESYRWLGDWLAHQLRELGVPDARRVDVAEARADVAALRSRSPTDSTAGLLLATCYGALSPHEVVVGQAKLVGLAQIHRRHAALFQFGILLRDQSRLAEFLRVPDEAARGQLRAELARRTVGLEQLLTRRAASEVAAAIAGATPSVP